MSDTVISVRNLGKKYKLGATLSPDTLRDHIMHTAKRLIGKGNGKLKHPGKEEFWALKDVSFDVKQGEVLGIIGPNGSGKSTLLKILTGITEPTEGEVKMRGRVGSLLEVGTGFHQELSGRENIYMNGAILGMTRAEIKAKFDEIVDFSGVEKFLDTPVKRYSSGMRVRLGFAVAAHLEPEILLIDEVLAVGDVQFQKKCLDKMNSIAGQGRTVIFVSHNMGAVSGLCSGALFLKDGVINCHGEVGKMIKAYLDESFSESKMIYHPEKIDENLAITFHSIEVRNKKGVTKNMFDVFEQVSVQIIYSINEELENTNFCLVLSKDGSDLIVSFDLDERNGISPDRKSGKYCTQVDLPCPLKAGKYLISIDYGQPKIGPIVSFKKKLGFEVDEISCALDNYGFSKRRAGLFAQILTWNHERINY